jgi:hypothetical protein
MAMKNRKGLAEYLFVDKPRIERYFQQLSAPVKYDKLPVWKVALGISGPKVEGSQSQTGREFSFEEKLQRVLSHMQSEDLLSATRPSLYNKEGEGGGLTGQPFVAEILSARRAAISRQDRALNIWVSLQTTKNRLPGALYLIEDFRGDDEFPNVYSGYSSLRLLAQELRWTHNTPLADALAELEEQDRAMSHFAADPIASLKTIGAQFGAQRDIYTVYRFRASCVEMRDRTLTTVGYPLVIREV